MGSLILRWKEGGAAAALWCLPAGILRSPNSLCGCRGIAAVSSSFKKSAATLPSRISPWLMLQPEIEGGGRRRRMVYKFYSIADDQVFTLDKQEEEEEAAENLPLPDDINDIKFVGSSHGWLALFNRRNNDLFLTNPLSGQHIKLPPIDTLPDPEINLKNGRGMVSKVILSCSPNQDECRAVMSFGPGERLAYCWPGNRNSAEWIPFGDLYLDDKNFLITQEYWSDHKQPPINHARVYIDFVYCSRPRLFSCLTLDMEMDDWDLRSPAPRRDFMQRLVEDEDNYEFGPWFDENYRLLMSCLDITYLVYAEQCDQLFLVTRYVQKRKGRSGDNVISYKTRGFLVDIVERFDQLRVVLEDDGVLDGLAMFVGTNHAFVMSAAEFPELKPNSIYFTDEKEYALADFRACKKKIYGGYDVGVFDYKNKTLSTCYYPRDCHDIEMPVPLPAPMWFTPSKF